MAVINTNVKALFSQAALTTSGRAQQLAMQQLSTGKRINSARDDAAGMAIATRMTQQIRGLNQAVRNAGDAINLIQTAEGATNEITDMMQRMRELAVQAVNDTNDNAQRSYLDLEFQQLKQQIVQISDNTEWNGFPVLNGTAGQRVGEMPVFKVTSENQYGSVFINPTTSRTVAGTDAGEKQVMTIGGTMPTLTGSQTMTITVGGVDVVLDATTAATASTVATQIQQTLSNNAAFNASSGRTVTVSGAALTITYAASDGNVANTSFDPKAATLLTASFTSPNPREAITQAGESFKGNGAFLNSGALTMSADTAGVVTASFKTSTGETIPMQGILNNSAVTETSAVTFNDMTAGQSITLGGLTYTASAANTAAQVAAAFASLSNGATGSVTTYGSFSGALSGFASGPQAKTVTFSTLTSGQTLNIGGLTYIANAAASATEVATDFANYITGTAPVKGTFTGSLSGYSLSSPTSSGITVSPNSTSAVSFTGSGSVSLTSTGNTVTFTSASTGTNVTNMPISGSGALPTVVVTQGAPAGSITFIKDSGLNAKVISDDLVYTFKKSDATAATLTSRAFSYSVSVEGSIPALRAGDLKINGIDIGASYATDDKLSPVGNAAGSAIAKAAAINRMAVATGVTQGEAQMLTFSGTPAPGTLNVAGVSVTITALDTTTAAVATKVAAALQASPLFASSTGRVVTYIPGNSNLTITYAPSEGNMPETVIQTGSTGVTGLVDTVADQFISSAGTGVFAKVNENVMTGRAMSGTSVVKGTVFINGFASADITTVLNNSRETRANVVRAINLISDKTGVKAIDTGVDAKGITLTAADGRNIEVSFETSANSDDFGARIGLRQGVQSSTISLESKIPAPVVLSSDSTGDIKRAGLISGNFSKNEAVANTSPRAVVGPNVAQVESVTYSGTVPVAGDTFSLTVNGTTFTYTANSTDGLTTQAVRNGLVALVNANTTVPVTATAGRNKGEILLTADSAGTSFTLTNSKSNSTTTVTATTVKANAKADFNPLGMDDLVINGVKIPASTSAGDIDSNTIATSSDPASSALAIAAAINSQTPLTGVLAKANGAEIKGTTTVTSLPVLSVPTFQSLFINGTEIKVQFVQNESATDRLNKVAEAINQRSGAHGVVATNNGNGISLKSDGRNMSVWFDSNVKDLSAANFGLDQGGAVAQSSQISFSGTYNLTDTASVTINGVQITSAASGTSADSGVGLATALETAINAAITSGAIKNVSVSRSTGTLTVTSTVAGSPFDIYGATMGGTTGLPASISINEVTPNSFGNNLITGIRDATASSQSARTVYGTVRMIAQAPMLPDLPKPIGAPPSEMDQLLMANAKPFTVSSGDDGFGPNSNFSALGFNEGSFGGRSSSDMDPPKVGRLAFQVGSSANQTVTIDLADFGKDGPITGEITGDVDQNIDQRTVRINTRDGATAVLAKLDSAMDKVNATRATMGAVMNRLDHVINNLTNVSMNLSTSRSGIEDADYASSSTELAKTQIMQQAATAVLAQANTSQQTVLKLLGG